MMASSQQDMLRRVWHDGHHGYLSALSEAKLWAIREVWRAEKRSLHGLQTFAAGLVTKIGSDEHPTQRAVGLFYLVTSSSLSLSFPSSSSSYSSSSSSLVPLTRLPHSFRITLRITPSHYSSSFFSSFSSSSSFSSYFFSPSSFLLPFLPLCFLLAYSLICSSAFSSHLLSSPSSAGSSASINKPKRQPQ